MVDNSGQAVKHFHKGKSLLEGTFLLAQALHVVVLGLAAEADHLSGPLLKDAPLLQCDLTRREAGQGIAQKFEIYGRTRID